MHWFTIENSVFSEIFIIIGLIIKSWKMNLPVLRCNGLMSGGGVA